MYNTVLLITVTMLYITFPGLIHLLTGITTFTYFPHLPPPLKVLDYLNFYKFVFMIDKEF